MRPAARSVLDALRSFGVTAGLAVLLVGCGTVKLDTHVTGRPPPILGGDIVQEKILVLWGTAWRSDQKQAARREEIASEAIGEYFRDTLGDKAIVKKTIDGRSPMALSDFQIAQSREVRASGCSSVVILRLEELGPTLTFYLSPILWEGTTDASFRVRILDVPSASLVSDLDVHWAKGGAFALRGASKLKEGLKSALSAVFEGAR